MNFILENTFLWEVDWRPLIKCHCLITMPGHYRGYFAGRSVAPPLKHTWCSSGNFNQTNASSKCTLVGRPFCIFAVQWLFVCLSLPELKGASQSTSLKAVQMHIHIFASKDATYGNHDSINMNNQTGPHSALCAVWYARVAPVPSCFVVLARVYVRVLRS